MHSGFNLETKRLHFRDWCQIWLDRSRGFMCKLGVDIPLEILWDLLIKEIEASPLHCFCVRSIVRASQHAFLLYCASHPVAPESRH